MAVPFDVDRLTVTGDAVPVLEGVSAVNWALSPNGTLAYVRNAVDAPVPATLVWMNRAGRPVGSAVSQPIENPRNLQLSPDGARVAVISGGRAPAGGELWIHDLAGRPPLPLVQERANDYPVWSPDGTRVAFQSGDAGVLPVFWLPADGSSRELQRVDTGANIAIAVWSRDGSELYYIQYGTLMAVAVKPGPKDIRFDSAVELFRVPYLGDQGGFGTGGVYDVSPDGRFLTIQPTVRPDHDPTPSGSIVVVQNWAEELKRLVPVK